MGMNHTEPRFIGKRIQVLRQRDKIEIRISQRIERWQEALLVGWLAAWTFCGVVFIYYLAVAPTSSDRIFFLIATAAWLYFFIRILKVYLWRRIGEEVILIEPGFISVRHAFGRYGRPDRFPLYQGFRLEVLRSNPTSFLAFMDDSFWIMGGERISFRFNGRQYQFGKQLHHRDADLLVRVIEGGVREYTKKI